MQHVQGLCDHISNVVLVVHGLFLHLRTWCSEQAIEGLGSKEGDNNPFLHAHGGMAKEGLILGGRSMSQTVFSGKGGSGQGRPEENSIQGKRNNKV